MQKILATLVIFFLSALAFSNQGSQKNVAIVKTLRGKAFSLNTKGEKVMLKKGDWLTEGSIIKTMSKTLVKLNFIDKSTMNIGPKSELKIEKFSKKEAGVINVLTGKIRSQVTKDYLEMNKEKSKLFVKSRNAVMGVRGTDFLFSANKKTGTTTTVLFEESIVFNKLHQGDSLSDLESVVNKGRRIRPGQVSVAMRSLDKPTVPSKLSTKQFNLLNKNKDFRESGEKNKRAMKSIVPPGLNGAAVSSSDDKLKSEIEKITNIKVNDIGKTSDSVETSKGYIQGDDIKPADGVYVHVESGTIISPGIDSSFDDNTNEWVSTTNGGANNSGEYIPPEGYKLTNDGQLLKVDSSGQIVAEVVLDIKPVDETPALNDAPTVNISKDVINAISNDDANESNLNSIKDELDKSIDEVIQEEEKILDNSPSGVNVDAGETVTVIPRPSDCSTCDQPETIFTNNNNRGATTRKSTLIKLKVGRGE